MLKNNTFLTPGESYTVTWSVTLPQTETGDRYVLIVNDYFNDQIETDENNNTVAIPITLGMADYDAQYTLWLENTLLTEALYTGEAGHTYQFYSVATDNAGNRQLTPPQAQASIHLGGGNNPPTLNEAIADQTIKEGQLFEFTIPPTTFKELQKVLLSNKLLLSMLEIKLTFFGIF